MTTKTAKRDVYHIVTDRIIEHLKKGSVPWKQPWTNAGYPQNLITRRPYRGINALLLASLHYEKNFFLTYKQVMELGGEIIEGERPCPIVFWKFPEDEKEGEAKRKDKKPPVLRYYSVYNVAQVEGISVDAIPTINERPNDPLKACECIIEDMQQKPKVQFKENRAYYNPFHDLINMPKLKTFTDSEAYYDTFFHELVHSTGHPSRLNRKEGTQLKSLGADAYSVEELIAEIGACFLTSITGIDIHFDNNVAYIQSWLKVLENDRHFIVYASARAQKAVDFILNIPPQDYDVETESEEVQAKAEKQTA